MKKWIVTYTEDNGQTTKTMPVQATTYTQAYLAVAIKLNNTNGLILEITEV